MAKLLAVLSLSLALVVGAGLFLPRDADARSSRVASYSVERTWPTAVRFLRIDLGYKIIERDAAAGYILFEATKGTATHRGSLELVKTTDHADRDSSKLILEVEKWPEYEEAWVLEKLLERLREDLGQPRDKEVEPPKPSEPPKDDDGADGGDKARDEKNE